MSVASVSTSSTRRDFPDPGLSHDLDERAPALTGELHRLAEHVRLVRTTDERKRRRRGSGHVGEAFVEEDGLHRLGLPLDEERLESVRSGTWRAPVRSRPG